MTDDYTTTNDTLWGGQDKLEYGDKVILFRDNKEIGEFIFDNKPYVGECFYRHEIEIIDGKEEKVNLMGSVNQRDIKENLRWIKL